MNERAVTSARTVGRETDEFSIIVDLFQSSTFNMYWFTLIMNELTNHIQDYI